MTGEDENAGRFTLSIDMGNDSRTTKQFNRIQVADMVGDEPDTAVKVPRRTSGVRPVPVVVVAEGPRTGTIHRFEPESENAITVGRTRESEFVVADPTLSRQHARFTWMRANAEFRMFVEDLQSTNGTSVNGKPADGVFLEDGDRIEMGEVILRFQLFSPSELIEHDRLLSKAKSADIDPLTELGTRHYMVEQVPLIFEECEVQGLPLSLILLDLDHFKNVNDTLGHQIGDQVLRAVSGIIHSHLRASALPIRYGGEELLVLLPGSALEGAQFIAERLRSAVAALDTRGIAETLRLTVSIGVAERRSGEAIDALLKRADAALYRAKGQGRNRVEIDQPT